MTATSPSPLPVPGAAPAAPSRPGTPAAAKNAESFAQQLARQRHAADEDARTAASGRPSGPAKTASGLPAGDSAPPQSPHESTADAPASLPAELGALAAATAATAAPAAAPAAQLPDQAIEIAAQAARLQQLAAAPLPAAAQGGETALATVTALPGTPAPETAATKPEQLAATAAPPAPSAKARHAVGALPATPVASPMIDAHGATASRDVQHGSGPTPWPPGPDEAAADAEFAHAARTPAWERAWQDTGSASADAFRLIAGHAAASQAAVRPDPGQAWGHASSTGPHSLGVFTPVAATPAWGADLGRQLVTLSHDAGQGRHTAELRLDPPDLGPLRVTLSVSDGVASASFVSAHAAVRHAVESALPQLQQALAQAGLSLGQASVGEHGSQPGFDMQQQSQQRGQGRGAMAASGDGPATTQTASVTSHRTDGLVDTFA